MDGNNLYGWAINKSLPYSEFNCLFKKIDKFGVNSVGENRPIAYILEFDLEYPHKLHELHNEYTLAPEKLKISHNMFSNYCSSIENECDNKLIN